LTPKFGLEFIVNFLMRHRRGVSDDLELLSDARNDQKADVLKIRMAFKYFISCLQGPPHRWDKHSFEVDLSSFLWGSMALFKPFLVERGVQQVSWGMTVEPVLKCCTHLFYVSVMELCDLVILDSGWVADKDYTWLFTVRDYRFKFGFVMVGSDDGRKYLLLPLFEGGWNGRWQHMID
jgi:hypothetical protein